MFRKWQTLRKRSKGFTLIELMIVVAIIAILAAIAIPQYRKFQYKAKTAEAKTNLGAIKTCEEAYAAEHDEYVLSAASPDSIPGSTKADWKTGHGFDSIGFAPASKVYYQYAVGTSSLTAGTDGSTNAVSDGTVDIYMFAQGNLDGKSGLSQFECTDEDPTIVDKNPGSF